MVHDLTHPLVKRAEEDRATINMVKIVNDGLKKKIDELLYLASKSSQRGGHVEELSTKMS